MRTILMTYCSARKAPDPGSIPALVRYRSDRIAGVAATAESLGLDFFILSGKYGLLAPTDPIPDYDHQLTLQEIPVRAAALTAQLQSRRIDQVLFYSRSLAVDPGVEAYCEAARRACAEAGIEFELVELS